MTQGFAQSTVLAKAPNALAPPARLVLGPGVALLRGYQSFTISGAGVIPDCSDQSLQVKQALLAPHWEAKLLQGRSVLDLGGNNGFFAWWALTAGAERATIVDLDPQVVEQVNRAQRHLGGAGLRAVQANVEGWQEPADVVLALALVHWLYACTAGFGSLDALVGWLAGLARHAAVIEWIAPQDSAIAEFGHLDSAAAGIREGYTYRAFRTALDRYFPRMVDLGFVTPTRRLFIAYKQRAVMDLSGPLPLLHPAETLLASRWLATLHFWTRTYDLGDVILKQTTHEQALREAAFLRMLEGPHFPRVLGTDAGDGYTTVRLEKVQGEKFAAVRERIAKEPASLACFLRGCLTILEQLAARGIRHRDIHEENLLVRDGLPVLLDFGWAVSDAMPYYTPVPLEEPAHASDTLALGLLLQRLLGPGQPELRRIAEQMADPDPQRRITDLRVLREFFEGALSAGSAGAEGGQP